MVKSVVSRRRYARLLCWLPLVGLAALGFAQGQSPQSSNQVLQPTGRRSNEPPVPARGKLGQDLFLAIDHRDTEAVKALLKQGADPNSLNGLEFRPLYLATASYQMDVMQELLKAGALPDAKSTYGTPLTFAAFTGNIVGAKILLDKGADPNTIRSDGLSVLMVAANAGNPALVEELLKHNADVKPQDDAGETALSFAARNGSLPIAQMLVGAGAEIDKADADGLTPLMEASMNGHADVVKFLLSKGAKANAKDSAGRTALILAARYGDYPDVARALIDGGANPNAKDTDGRTAAAIAASRGYASCASTLGATASAMEPRSVEKALDLSLGKLQSSMLTFTQSATCVSCHHEGLGRITTGEASERGFKVNPELQNVQMQRLHGMLIALKGLHQQALVNPEAAKQIPLMEMNEVNTTYTWLLAGLAAHNDPPTDATAAMAMVLARQQTPAGCWAFSFPRVPMQSSPFTFTALAVRALNYYGPKDQETEISGRIAKAKDWLLHAEAKSSEDRASRLLGLKWAGADAKDMQPVVQAILADQRKDGGWSQTPDLPSDAYATGQALFALHSAGGVPCSDAAYDRGVKFLLRTQDEDGTWYASKRAIPANNYFDAGFPHGESQFASFNATCWATLGLLETVDKKVASK